MALFQRATCLPTNGLVSRGHVPYDQKRPRLSGPRAITTNGSVCAFRPKASILRATCLQTSGLLFEGHEPSDQRPSFSAPRALRPMASFLRATRPATRRPCFLRPPAFRHNASFLRATCPRTSGLASRGHAPYDKWPSLYGPNVLRPGVMDTFHPHLKCGPVT